MGQLVDKIIVIIFNFRVGTWKNKNIDYQGEETCAYKSYHISLLSDSTFSNALNLCYYNPKEKYPIRRKINRKNKNICKINIIIVIIILVCQKLASVGTGQQKIKLPSPNNSC